MESGKTTEKIFSVSSISCVSSYFMTESTHEIRRRYKQRKNIKVGKVLLVRTKRLIDIQIQTFACQRNSRGTRKSCWRELSSFFTLLVHLLILFLVFCNVLLLENNNRNDDDNGKNSDNSRNERASKCITPCLRFSFWNNISQTQSNDSLTSFDKTINA